MVNINAQQFDALWSFFSLTINKKTCTYKDTFRITDRDGLTRSVYFNWQPSIEFSYSFSSWSFSILVSRWRERWSLTRVVAQRDSLIHVWKEACNWVKRCHELIINNSFLLEHVSKLTRRGSKFHFVLIGQIFNTFNWMVIFVDCQKRSQVCCVCSTKYGDGKPPSEKINEKYQHVISLLLEQISPNTMQTGWLKSATNNNNKKNNNSRPMSWRESRNKVSNKKLALHP